MDVIRRESAALANRSTQSLVRQLSSDLVERGGGRLEADAEPEIEAALSKGVEHLRGQGLSDEAIRDHLIRNFYTVRHRLFSESEARPSPLWTVFEYIGGLPLLVIISVVLLLMAIATGGADAGGQFEGKMVAPFLQLVVAAAVGLYLFMSRFDVSDGVFQRTRFLFLRSRAPLATIHTVGFQKRHLFGQRRVNVVTSARTFQIHSRIRGFHATAFLLSFLPDTVISPEVRKYLREAWFRVPLESNTFQVFAAIGLIAANALWYLHWGDIRDGNGVTWYSLAALIISLTILTLMISRVTGSARRGVLRFTATYWLTIVFLTQGLLLGPHEWTHLALYPLSLCVSLPLLVLFLRERHLLVVTFAALSALATYKAVTIYKSMNDGVVFSTPGFVIELKQRPDGLAWISHAANEQYVVGQLRDGLTVETALEGGPWSFVPSPPEHLYLGLATGGAGSSIVRIEDDGGIEPLSEAPARWVPSKWNSDLIWYGDHTYLLTAVTGESTSPVKLGAANLVTGELNDFDGMGSPNVARQIDDYRFEAIWFTNMAPQELKLISYDVRTTETRVIRSESLQTTGSTGVVHLPKSSCVLIQRPVSSTSQRLSIVDVADGRELELGVTRNNNPYSWNPGKRLFAYAAETEEATVLSAVDVNSGARSRKELRAGTRIDEMRLAPDGTGLFYISYRKGFPYIFGRMIKGEVWEIATGTVKSAYQPGAIQGILTLIASHRVPEHSPVQWTNDSRAILAPELDLQPQSRGLRQRMRLAVPAVTQYPGQSAD